MKADESSHDDVLAQFGDFLVYQILDTDVLVLDEALIQKAAFLVKEFVDLAIDDSLNDLLGFALTQSLLTVDLSLSR